MPTKPPSDRMHAKGVFPMINPYFQCGMHPAPKKRETNPISTRKIYETNPISTPADLWRTKNTKRTQSQLPPSPITRNEPNSTQPTPNRQKPKAAFYETNPIPPPPTAKSKQPTAKKCETNPISAYQVPRRPLFPQNEPNFHQCGLNANGGHYFSTWRSLA